MYHSQDITDGNALEASQYGVRLHRENLTYGEWRSSEMGAADAILASYSVLTCPFLLHKVTMYRPVI